MPNTPMPQRDIGEIIMTAINEVGCLEGASLDDIEKYLKSALNDVPDSEKIQSILDDAVAKKFLLKMDNGNYRINGSEEQTKAMPGSANTGTKTFPKLHENDLEKARRLSDDVTKYAKEKAQEAERAVRKAAESENQNADSDVGNVSSRTEKKCTNTSHPHDDCKHKTTAECTDDCAKKCAQKVERPADSVAQDAKEISDSGSKNVDSTKAKEEKAKVPLSDEDDVKDIEKMMKDIKMKK